MSSDEANIMGKSLYYELSKILSDDDIVYLIDRIRNYRYTKEYERSKSEDETRYRIVSDDRRRDTNPETILDIFSKIEADSHRED